MWSSDSAGLIQFGRQRGVLLELPMARPGYCCHQVDLARQTTPAGRADSPRRGNQHQSARAQIDPQSCRRGIISRTLVAFPVELARLLVMRQPSRTKGGQPLRSVFQNLHHTLYFSLRELFGGRADLVNDALRAQDRLGRREVVAYVALRPDPGQVAL